MATRSVERPDRMIRLPPSIDAAARDGRLSVRSRAIVAAVTVVVLAANVGTGPALLWAAIYVATEAWDWWVTRAVMTGAPMTEGQRAGYLAAVAAMTLNWSGVGAIYWFSGGDGLKVAAVIAIAAQLIHAQAFAFRSVPVLAVSAGIPAVALIALPLGFGDFEGVERMTLMFSWLMSIAYVAASARSNIAVAARLLAAQEELEQLAYFDALTLLGNRRRFAENLRRRIEFSTRNGTRFALMVIDLDRFKQINDTLGHGAGDTVLVEVGRRLRLAVGDAENIARTGGDEFAVLLDAAADPAAIEATCQRICDSVAQAIDCNGVPVAASVSVGVAHFPDDGTRLDSLLQSADRALYASKAGGRGTWRRAAAV